MAARFKIMLLLSVSLASILQAGAQAPSRTMEYECYGYPHDDDFNRVIISAGGDESHDKCEDLKLYDSKSYRRYGEELSLMNRRARPWAVEPVCGSNGRTYCNVKALGYDRKCSGSDITVSSYGPCENNSSSNERSSVSPKDDPCNCYGVDYGVDQPVCGINGKTYRHWRLLACLNKCLDGKTGVTHGGVCFSKTNL